MGIPITGVQAAQRARKALPKGKTQVYVTPGWDEDEQEEPPPVESRGPQMLTDAQKKLKRLQRA